PPITGTDHDPTVVPLAAFAQLHHAPGRRERLRDPRHELQLAVFDALHQSALTIEHLLRHRLLHWSNAVAKSVPARNRTSSATFAESRASTTLRGRSQEESGEERG